MCIWSLWKPARTCSYSIVAGMGWEAADLTGGWGPSRLCIPCPRWHYNVSSRTWHLKTCEVGSKSSRCRLSPCFHIKKDGIKVHTVNGDVLLVICLGFIFNLDTYNYSLGILSVHFYILAHIGRDKIHKDDEDVDLSRRKREGPRIMCSLKSGLKWHMYSLFIQTRYLR